MVRWGSVKRAYLSVFRGIEFRGAGSRGSDFDTVGNLPGAGECNQLSMEPGCHREDRLGVAGLPKHPLTETRKELHKIVSTLSCGTHSSIAQNAESLQSLPGCLDFMFDKV